MSKVLSLRNDRRVRLIFFVLAPWPVLCLYLAGSALNRYAPGAISPRVGTLGFALVSTFAVGLALTWFITP